VVPKLTGNPLVPNPTETVVPIHPEEITPVTKHTELTTHTRGMFSRTRNELHG
jgi:hypothetical protein